MFVCFKNSVGLSVAGLLLFGIPSVVFSQDPKSSADIVVQSLKVQTTKKGGDAWDVGGGAPDVKVLVRQTSKGGQSHTTKVKTDTFETSFGERTIRVSVGDKIEVIVYDEDLKGDDVVGKATRTVSAAMLKDRELKLSFDQVISLVLEFEP